MSIWNKKIVILSILLLSVCLLCSCKKEDVSKVTNPYEDMERMYIAGEIEGSELSVLNTLETNREIGLGMPFEKKTMSDVRETIKIDFFGDKEFNYSYSECRKKDVESKEYGDFYSIYDYYECENEKVGFLRETELLCVYENNNFFYDEHDEYPEKSIEEVVMIATDFLLEFMSDEYFMEFKMDVESYDAYASNNRYKLKYLRYIEGYCTDESIEITIDRAGNVESYKALNLKKYEATKDDITKEKLEAAENAIIAKINKIENIKIFKWGRPYIVTNTSGDIYMRYAFMSKGGSATLYVNIHDIK